MPQPDYSRLAVEQDAGLGATPRDRQSVNPPLTEEVTVCDGQVAIDIVHIAKEAVQNFEARNQLAVNQLFERAVRITGSDHTARMAFIRAFAQRAAVARRTDWSHESFRNS